jgi:serine/threonine protein kinase
MTLAPDRQVPCAFHARLLGRLVPPSSNQATDRFVIEARVGGGAGGEIFKGIDQVTGQPVAVKVLRHNASDGETARFKREIAVIADLRHPNIVDYVSHGQWSDGRLYMAMEWLDGEDLAKRQRRAPLGTRDAVEVIRRAAQALAAIHSRGIVHRDLKLSNLFLVKGRGTAVKLIDFGVVKPPGGDEFETEAGTILGTPHHMAPEQARGAHVDARADVYALGSVLFRLLTGRNVFETEHVIALLGRLVLEDPPRPSQFRFDIPEKLDAVIHRAIARNAEARYENAGEFARALARVGTLNNDPPQVERSASQVRPKHTTEDTGSGSSGSRGTRPGLRMRRIVAVMLYDLGETSVDRSIGDSLLELAGEDVRIEQLAGGKTVAVLGVEHSRGDEVMRAARAALQVLAEYPEARAVVSTGHAVMARSNLAGEALDRAAAQAACASTSTPPPRSSAASSSRATARAPRCGAKIRASWRRAWCSGGPRRRWGASARSPSCRGSTTRCCATRSRARRSSSARRASASRASPRSCASASIWRRCRRRCCAAAATPPATPASRRSARPCAG